MNKLYLVDNIRSAMEIMQLNLSTMLHNKVIIFKRRGWNKSKYTLHTETNCTFFTYFPLYRDQRSRLLWAQIITGINFNLSSRRKIKEAEVHYSYTSTVTTRNNTGREDSALFLAVPQSHKRKSIALSEEERKMYQYWLHQTTSHRWPHRRGME